MNKLVIFGVGLIGGSLALALKQAGAVKSIVGVGRNEESLNEALLLGIIDAKCIPNATQSNLGEVCTDADMIVIAAPVAQTQSILQSIQPHIKPNTVITDAGSTKSDVLTVAQAVLGPQFSQFVGAHPIAGAEKTGPAAAKSDLFAGKNVIITPATQTNKDAASRATSLWQTCGANVSEMTAQAHDEVFAAVSHLPHLLAFALVNEIANRPNAEQLFSFAASGFRDFTRIAGSSPEMWRDISLANKSALLKEIKAYQQQLTHIETLLNNNDGASLEALFQCASIARNNWAKNQ